MITFKLKIMKFKLFVYALMLLPIMSMAQNKNYTINGIVSGSTNGTKVYLKSEGIIEKPIDDSTVIMNGKFKFSGSLAAPLLVKLIVDQTPKDKKSGPNFWRASNFYLDRGDISYSGKIDSLPTFYYKKNAKTALPVITGSKAQDESERYNSKIIGLKKELSQVDDEYNKVYHFPAMEGKFNTREGIVLANKYNALEQKIQDYTFAYIHAHPESIIAFDQAYYMLAGYTNTPNIPQINDLVKTISSAWQGTYNLSPFMEASVKARKTALGIKYQDFEFTTPDGQKVMLSKYVPKGKVVMLEFWASWCGPCRAEIPHLKYLTETKSDVFSIVSISLDENKDAWKKAMKEEGMDWAQLNDAHGFEGEIAKAYNIFGIPQSLVLDREGRIMKVGLRGAFLDAYIDDMVKQEAAAAK